MLFIITGIFNYLLILKLEFNLIGKVQETTPLNGTGHDCLRVVPSSGVVLIAFAFVFGFLEEREVE